MSSIKISELTEVTQLNSNTAKNLIVTVDLVTGQTNKMTVKNLAANLYSNNNLIVTQSITSNTIVSNTITSNIIVSDTTTIIQGVDVSQNTRLTVIEGTDTSQNVRLDYSNTAITIIQGVTATQNTNISNKVNLTGSNNQTISGNVTISQNLISNTITSNTITVTQSNVINLFVTQANVANVTLISNGTFQLGQVDYLDATNTRTSYQPNLTKIALLTNADFDLSGSITSSDSLAALRLLIGTYGPSSYPGWQPSLQLANNKTTGISFFRSAIGDQSTSQTSEGFLALTSGSNLTDKISNYIRLGQYYTNNSVYNSPGIVLKPNTSSPWTAGVGIGADPQSGTVTGISSNSNTSGSLVVYGGAGVTGNVYVGGVVSPEKGLVYLPLVYPGAQTAITLDFANNSLVRANASSGVVASFSNLIAGKTVDLWITNTSGGTIVFTHGCSSLYSTVGATTYTIPATSSIRASYVSFGTDVANTFVAITK